VLDVGCGPGTNTPYFTHARYLGIDHNLRYLEYARQRYRQDFLVADIARWAVAPRARFDFALVNSLLHHVDTPSARGILLQLRELLTDDGHVHIIDLVLPKGPSLARFLTRRDRGKFARPLQDWKEIFAEAFETVAFEPFELTGLGVTLWQLVYFKGRAKKR
jgi:SAM-dependent methyltransferase